MFQTLIRLFKLLLLSVLLGGVASALSVVVMDRDLQNTLGTGQSVNGKLSLQLRSGASGPVVVFIKSDNGQTQSYPGVLRGGTLSLSGTSLASILAGQGVTLVLPGGSGNTAAPRLPSSAPPISTPALKVPPGSALPVKVPPVSVPPPLNNERSP